MRLASFLTAIWLFAPNTLALPSLIPNQSELWTDTTANGRLLKRGLANNVQLRILPLGASIVNGGHVPDKNGFRYALRNKLVYDGNPVNMIGSLSVGSMMDNNVEGWSGYMIDAVAEKAKLDYYAQPNIVLIHVGTNDMFQNPVDAHVRLGRLFDALFSNMPGVTIIASTLLPNGDPTGQANIVTYNRNIANIVGTRQRAGQKITYVDFSSSWFSLADLISDGTHPTAAGYLKMAAVWYQGIEVAANAGWIKAANIVPGVSDVVVGGNTCWQNPASTTGPFKTQGGSGRNDGPYIHTPVSVTGFDGFKNPSSVGFNNPWAEGVYWADINGDGVDDYVYVAQDSALGFGVSLSSATGERGPYLYWTFKPSCDRSGIRWADMTGDGRDDFCCLLQNADLYCWQNTPGSDERAPIVSPMGLVFPSRDGLTRDRIRLADIDGDGRADYVFINLDGKSMGGFRNGAVANLKPAYWTPMKGVIDDLPVLKFSGWRFVDLNGDHRDDLVWVDDNGKVTTWINQRGYSVGYHPVWVSMGVTHGGGSSPTNVTFGAFMGSGRADYSRITNNADGNVHIDRVRNDDIGGKMVKGDGARYCDMTGKGADDYIWISSMGEMALYQNTGTPGVWDWRDVIYDAKRTRREVHLADFTGDGKCDILLVDKATGATTVIRNDYNLATNKFAFTNIGVQTGAATCNEGYGYYKHDLGVQWHDMDGDGRADFLCIKRHGYVSGWLNRGPGDMQNYGQIKFAEGNERRHMRFADIDGDGRSEMLRVDPVTGQVKAWRNLGPTNSMPGGSSFLWAAPAITSIGNLARGECVEFGNLNGKNRADYILVDPQVNSALSYFNICTDGGVAAVAPNLPAGAPPAPVYPPPPVVTAIPNTSPPSKLCVPGNGLDFACVKCADTNVDDSTKTPDVRWKAAKGDSALAEHTKYWKDMSTAAHTALGQQNTYIRSLSYRFDGPKDWSCPLAAATTCSVALDCSAVPVPAVSMIMTQWASLRTFYYNQYLAIGTATTAMNENAGQFSVLFSPEQPDPNKAFGIFIDMMMSGFGIIQASSWVSSIDKAWFNPELIGTVVETSVEYAKSKLKEPMTALEIQNEVTAAISAVTDRMQQAIDSFVKNIFNGTESSMNAMNGMLKEGKWLDPDIRESSLYDMNTILQRTLYGMLLTKTWSINTNNNPFILVVDQKDYQKNPTKIGGNMVEVSDDDIEEARVALGDKTFYLLNQEDCITKIPDQDGFPQCFDGGSIKGLDGINALQKSPNIWGSVTKEDIIVSSVQGWELNGHLNGYSMPENSKHIDGQGTLSNLMFVNGIRTPGFFGFPICTYLVASVAASETTFGGKKKCDTYPCCDYD